MEANAIQRTEPLFNKRFLNFQSAAGHDIKVILDDDRKHIMFEINSHCERFLYFPEFVKLAKYVRNELGSFGKEENHHIFSYLAPTEAKTTHAIKCVNDNTNNSFILMTINEQSRVKAKFTTTYQIFVEFIEWLDKEYLNESATKSEISIGLGIIDDILVDFTRL